MTEIVWKTIIINPKEEMRRATIRRINRRLRGEPEPISEDTSGLIQDSASTAS